MARNVHHTRAALTTPRTSYTTTRSRSEMPSSPTCRPNCTGPGSMCGSEVERSAMASMSKKTAPGMCASSNSRRGSRARFGMCQLPSTTRTRGPGRSSCSASHSVLTRVPGRVGAMRRTDVVRADRRTAVPGFLVRALTGRRGRDCLATVNRASGLALRGRGGEAELRQLGETIQGHHAFVLLAVDHPGGIGAHGHLLAQILTRIDALGIALHVRQLIHGRPEPGLLLFARGSPERPIEDRVAAFQMLGEGHLIAGGGREVRRENERAEKHRDLLWGVLVTRV